MQKRKNRIEQWRAERRTMLGIDKVMQQSVAHAATVRKLLLSNFIWNFLFFFKGKTWSLEDEHDEDEEDLSNVVIPPTDAKRNAAISAAAEADKQREAMERAAEAAALAAAALASIPPAADEDEDDPLDKFMETISKEVKSFRGNNATIISSKPNGNNIKQENNKGSVVKVITKTVKTEVRGKISFELNNLVYFCSQLHQQQMVIILIYPSLKRKQWILILILHHVLQFVVV